MYSILLFLHSWVRWIVLVLGVLAVARAFMRSRGWTPAHDAAGKWFSIGLDAQVTLGLILYAISPIVRMALGDPGAAMRDAVLRYFLLEHILAMVIAIALVHVGRARIRKATSDAGKFRAAAIFFTLGLISILIGIPWPFLKPGRPLIAGW